MLTMLKQEFSELQIFEGLSEAQLKLLASVFEVASFEANELIFEQGQPARYMYVLIEGEVVIRYKPYDGPALVVSRIPPGGVFGWSTILSRSAYTSGAEAVVKSSACRISSSQLKTICENEPETGAVLMERFANAIAERRSTRTPVLDILSSRFDTSGECNKRNGEK